MTEAFVSRPAPRLIFGPGMLRELPAAVRSLGGTSVFIVSDPGIARAGHLDRAVRLLADAGIPAAVFSESRENPTESDAAVCRERPRQPGGALGDPVVGELRLTPEDCGVIAATGSRGGEGGEEVHGGERKRCLNAAPTPK